MIQPASLPAPGPHMPVPASAQYTPWVVVGEIQGGYPPRVEISIRDRRTLDCQSAIVRGPKAKENAARIVECVNALAGFPRPAADVPALVGALQICANHLGGHKRPTTANLNEMQAAVFAALGKTKQTAL